MQHRLKGPWPTRCVFAGALWLAWLAAGAALAEPAGHTVTLIPWPVRDLSPHVQDSIIGMLGQELSGRSGVQVLATRGVGQALWQGLDPRAEDCGPPFLKMVIEGKRAYQQLQIDRTLQWLEQAKERLAQCGEEIRDPQVLVDVHLYLGLAWLAKAQQSKATQLMQQALFYMPGYMPSEKEFPPDVITLFRDVKQNAAAQMPLPLALSSAPAGATVFLDGRRVGQTPLDKLSILPGLHFLRLEQNGYAPWTTTLQPKSLPSQLEVSLLPRWQGPSLQPLLSWGMKNEPPSGTELELLRQVSSFLGSDTLLMLSFYRDGRKILLGVRPFGVESEALPPPRLFDLGSDAEAWPGKIRGLVSTFEPLLTRPSEGGPRQRREPEAFAPLTRSEPSAEPFSREPAPRAPRAGKSWYDQWYQKWWFWTAVGVLTGTAVGVTVWMTLPDKSWTLTIGPQGAE